MNGTIFSRSHLLPFFISRRGGTGTARGNVKKKRNKIDMTRELGTDAGMVSPPLLAKRKHLSFNTLNSDCFTYICSNLLQRCYSKPIVSLANALIVVDSPVN